MATSQKATPTDLKKATVGFMGAGKIVELLIKGLINHSKIPAAQIYVVAPSSRNLKPLREKFPGVNTTTKTGDMFEKYNCDIVFIAVPGSVIEECEKSGKGLTRSYLQQSGNQQTVVCSLVGDVDLKRIKATVLDPKHLNESKTEFHRVAINAASAYGCGLCAVDVNPNSEQLSPLLKDLLASLSKELVYVPEPEMDAASLTIYSGTVFSYYLLSALISGAAKFGISDEAVAKKLVTQAMTSACQVQAVCVESYEKLVDEACVLEDATTNDATTKDAKTKDAKTKDAKTKDPTTLGINLLVEKDVDGVVKRAAWDTRKQSFKIATLEEESDESADEK